MKLRINNIIVDVPPKTLEVVKLIDELVDNERKYLNNEIKGIDCMLSEYAFLVTLLGQKTVDKIFGKDINKIDFSMLVGSITLILDQYNKPILNALKVND